MKSIFTHAALAVFSSVFVSSTVLAADGVASVWKVTSDSNTVYVVGALPFLRESDQPLPAQVKQAFDESKKVVFEVDPKQAKDEETQRTIFERGMYANGGSIKDEVSKETYKALGEFLEASGGEANGLDQFRPWFASIVISMSEMMKHGLRTDLGVSGTVEGWALEADKPMAGIEGMFFEIDLLRSLPEGVHEYMLQSSLEDAEEGDEAIEEFDEMVKFWRVGDVEAMEKLGEEDDTEWDKMMEEKLVQMRSGKWVKKIAEVLEGDEATMYVLGIQHLVGEGDLLELLEGKGYKVEQLKLKGAKKEKKKKDEEEAKKPALIPVSVS